MSKRSKGKGVVAKRRDGSTYTQDRRPPGDDQHAAMLARIRADVDREKRLRILQGRA